jgi:von Willebrand factor type A domain/Aerotolerance regulator N-terminal
LGEFIGMAGVVSAGLVALYLLDRSKRRQVVATLRFWTAGQMPDELKHKRRIHQPWSLLLQALSLLLLLLAMAGPRWSGTEGARDHVLLLDTSAWMGARARQGILLDQAKSAALSYVNSVAPADRVMLVQTDALATPVTAFEADHKVISDAIRRSQPSTSALNLEQAFEFAQQAQTLQSQKAGEIVFVGAGRIPRQDADLIAPPNLRVVSIPAAGENVGVRKLGVRRAPAGADQWEAYVGLRNDGARPREVELLLSFAGAAAGSKTLTLEPGAETQSTFAFAAKTGGLVEARIRSTNGRGDAFPQDDRAAIDLPVGKTLRVAVYSPEPELLKPLFAANAQMQVSFDLPAKYDARSAADIVIFDRFAPPVSPAVPAIWIEPPTTGSPFTTRTTAANLKLDRWHTDTPVGAGLFTKDAELATAQVFSLLPGDQAVAEGTQGPVVVARPGAVKMVALGFDPVRSSMRYDLATPLLMANILRWMAPQIFRRSDVQAGNVGTMNVALENGVNRGAIKVFTEDQRPLPFTIAANTLQFFAGAPGTVHVVMGDRESIYSLTLPDLGDLAWHPPAGVARGIARASLASGSAFEFWPWLALAGGLGLLIDWLLYGRSRVTRLLARSVHPTLLDRLRRKQAS